MKQNTKPTKLKFYTFQSENGKFPVCEKTLCRACMLRTISWYNDTIDPYIDPAQGPECEDCGETEEA